MKARRKSDGEIIEVKKWQGATDVFYATPTMSELYKESDLDFTLSEPEEEVMIDGWVARDSDGDLGIFAVKPERVRYKDNNKNGLWMARTITELDSEAFPSVTWESDALPVTITIKPKKK